MVLLFHPLLRCPGLICPPLGPLTVGCSHEEVDKICQDLEARTGILSARWLPSKVLAAAVRGRFSWAGVRSEDGWPSLSSSWCSRQWGLGHLQSQLSSHSSWPSNNVPLSDLGFHLPYCCMATLMALLSGLYLFSLHGSRDSCSSWEETSTSFKLHILANILSMFQVPLLC